MTDQNFNMNEAPKSTEIAVSGLSMEPFSDLRVIKVDGTSVRFTDAVAGFILNEGDSLGDALVRAAEGAVVDFQKLIFVPKEAE